MVESLLEIIQSTKTFRSLLLGDFLLDAYTTGKVKRISPEAPVPILEVIKEESRPGGAGNVALSLVALGSKVEAIGRVGDDLQGRILSERLVSGGVKVDGLLQQKEYRTPIKNRLIADSQQILRVDVEKIEPISFFVEEAAMDLVSQKIQNVDVVAISDYGKGFLSRKLLAHVIQKGKEAKVPVVVDPKGLDFTKYKGSTLIKPNSHEAYGAAKMEETSSLDQVAASILNEIETKWLLITRSEAGMSLFDDQKKRFDFPVRAREVRDVTGAGDTALAVICFGMGMKIDLSSAIQLANIAASIAIERIGCAQVKLLEIAERLIET
jgi:rfaE bifunctional protein kinase chain/domain